MAPPIGESHLFDNVAGGASGICDAGEFERQHDVFERVQRRHEVKRLEYESDAIGPYLRAAVLVELAQIGAVQYDITVGR